MSSDGSGRKAAQAPAFKWVNAALGDIKAALVANYRAALISASASAGSRRPS